MVHSPDDTLDLCQETFLKVFQNLHQFHGDHGLKSWVGKVAFTVALRHLEGKSVPIADTENWTDAETMLESQPSEFNLENACADEQLVKHVQHEIQQLPPLLRTVLTLYHLEDLSISDIAEITGLPSGTIKSHLYRARLRLRNRMEFLQG